MNLGRYFITTVATRILRKREVNPIVSASKLFSTSSWKIMDATSGSSDVTGSVSAEEDKSKPFVDEKLSEDLHSVLVSTVLNLEKLDPYLFRAKNMWHAFGPGHRLFGGQIIGQAMVASGRTVDPALKIHSLHSYFVHSGDSTIPVLYRVVNQRDGHSFSTRTVEAIQNGRIILTMLTSHHRSETSPFQHQLTMPVVPDPDTMSTDMDFLKQIAENADFPEKTKKLARKMLAQEITFETKTVDRSQFFARYRGEQTEPRTLTWIKVKGHIGENTGEGGMDLQHCCLAYISDLFLAGVPSYPNRNHEIGMIVSLDHSMWFHAPCRIDEWMLYECESPQSGNARGITFGRFWRQDGVLAVTVAQESLLRPKL